MENNTKPKISLINISKIKWACRRGMLEIDVLLQPFAENVYLSLTEAEQAAFVKLLEYPDPDLFNWLMAKDKPSEPALAAIIDKIRQYAQSKF